MCYDIIGMVEFIVLWRIKVIICFGYLVFRGSLRMVWGGDGF